MAPVKRMKNQGPAAKRQRRDWPTAAPSRFPRKSGGMLSLSKFQPPTKAEAKWIESNPTFPATTVTTSTLTLLNGLSQGTTAITRVGTKVYMKSLFVRIAINLTLTSASMPVRVLVVYDKETNGTALAATDVLASDSLCGPNNLYRPGRFITLLDEYMLPIQTFAGAQGYFMNRYVKIGLPVLFNNGNAGTVADISSGSIYALTNVGGAAFSGSVTNNSFARIRFTDA